MKGSSRVPLGVLVVIWRSFDGGLAVQPGRVLYKLALIGMEYRDEFLVAFTSKVPGPSIVGQRALISLRAGSVIIESGHLQDFGLSGTG